MGFKQIEFPRHLMLEKERAQAEEELVSPQKFHTILKTSRVLQDETAPQTKIDHWWAGPL